MGYFLSNRGYHAFVTFSQTLIYIVYRIKGNDLMTNEIRLDPGEDVRFNCSTPSRSSADWQYQRTRDARKVNIFIGNAQGGGGGKSKEYRFRTNYRVEIDVPFGRYDLLISNIIKTDEGFYYCSDTSDPDSVVNWKLTVLGEQKVELCSNDVSTAIFDTVNLTFPTVKKDSIHLEHRSVDRNYPLHAFRDGRLVNDYYVLSKRFSFSSYDNSWILTIKDVLASDAGSFICTEDNGLGKQYVKELVVIDATGVVCSASVETCHDDLNATCIANYFGHCPPRLHFGDSQVRNETRVITANTVSITAIINGTEMPSCRILTQSYVVNSTCKKPACREVEDKINLNPNAIVLTSSIVSATIILTISIAAIFIIWILKRKGNQSHRHDETTPCSPTPHEKDEDCEI